MISNFIRKGFREDIYRLVDDELLACMRQSYDLTDDHERSIICKRLTERLIDFIDNKYEVDDNQDF